MINAVPSFDAAGRVSEVIVSILDMTDRKKAMEKLRASQKRYQSIYQGTPLYATTWQHKNGDFILLDANQAANKSSNHVIQKHIGEKASVFLKNSAWILEAVRQCHKQKSPIEKQGWLVTKTSGQEKYFRLFINSIPPDLVLVLAQDLTENTQTREALTRREAQFRVLFEQAIDAILFLDETGTLLDANQAALTLFGLKKNRMGMYAIFDLAPEESRHQLGRLVDEKPKTLEIPELVFQKPGGPMFPGSIRSFRSTVKGKTVIFLFIRDLTRQKAQENKKRGLEAQLRRARKMESIGNLAGGISHDFNNILSSIIGYTELALEDVEKGSMLEDDLTEIFTAGKRARDLIRQILAFARQSEEDLVPVRVSGIVEEALNLIRSSIPSSIEISRQIESDDLILGLPTQVHQLVINLCTNAAQAMKDETGVLGVTLKKVNLDERFPAAYVDLAAGRYLQLSVSDTGTGILPELRESIFEPYFTTKKPGEGTGMGLATVHGIVKRYGGEITVDSRLGKGSVFHVFLPVTKKRPEEEDLPRRGPAHRNRAHFAGG